VSDTLSGKASEVNPTGKKHALEKAEEGMRRLISALLGEGAPRSEVYQRAVRLNPEQTHPLGDDRLLALVMELAGGSGACKGSDGASAPVSPSAQTTSKDPPKLSTSQVGDRGDRETEETEETEETDRDGPSAASAARAHTNSASNALEDETPQEGADAGGEPLPVARPLADYLVWVYDRHRAEDWGATESPRWRSELFTFLRHAKAHPDLREAAARQAFRSTKFLRPEPEVFRRKTQKFSAS
jgi:hypothetical protein